MSKPEDVSQEAWDAVGAWADWYVADPFRTVEEAIARAIMAAKAEEREDIWAIAVGNAVGERELERLARNAGDAEGCLLHALLARENEQLAAAIRKRGEVNTAHKISGDI